MAQPIAVSFYPQGGEQNARLCWPQGLVVEVGMSIRDCLGQLREHLTDAPIQIVADETRPYEVDAVLELPSQGLRLRFHALHHRLVIVDVFNPTKITLLAGDSGQPFTGAAGPPSFQAAYALFGPTYPGRLERYQKAGRSEGCDSNKESSFASVQESVVFMLLFPGVAFEFPVPPELEPAFAAPGLAFQPPFRCPGAQRLYFFHGHDVHAPQLPPLESGGGLRYMEPCHVCFNGSSSSSNDSSKNASGNSTSSESLGLKTGAPTVLCFPDRGQGSSRSTMVLGKSTPQDVMALLGSPASVFHQHDPRVYSAAGKASAAVAAMNAAAGAGPGVAGNLGSLNSQGGTSGSSSSGSSTGLNLSSSGSSRGRGGNSGTLNGEDLLGDYFFGYPDAGLDVQFHGSFHVVHKVHLTANLPGRPDFMTYDRCCYTLLGLPPPKKPADLPPSSLQPLQQDYPNFASGPTTETQISSVASAEVSLSAARGTNDAAASEQPNSAVVVSAATATVNIVSTSPTSVQKKPAVAAGEEVTTTAPASASKKKKKKGKGDSSGAASKSAETVNAVDEIGNVVAVKNGPEDTEVPQADAEAAVQLALKAAAEAKSNAENQVAAILSDDMTDINQRIASAELSSTNAMNTTANSLPPVAGGTPSLADDPPPFVTVETPWADLEARLFEPSRNEDGSSSSSPTGPLDSKPHFAVQNGDGPHPFGPTLLYCAEPLARALFEVTCDGFVCALTLY